MELSLERFSLFVIYCFSLITRGSFFKLLRMRHFVVFWRTCRRKSKTWESKISLEKPSSGAKKKSHSKTPETNKIFKESTHKEAEGKIFSQHKNLDHEKTIKIPKLQASSAHIQQTRKISSLRSIHDKKKKITKSHPFQKYPASKASRMKKNYLGARKLKMQKE